MKAMIKRLLARQLRLWADGLDPPPSFTPPLWRIPVGTDSTCNLPNIAWKFVE